MSDIFCSVAIVSFGMVVKEVREGLISSNDFSASNCVALRKPVSRLYGESVARTSALCELKQEKCRESTPGLKGNEWQRCLSATTTPAMERMDVLPDLPALDALYASNALDVSLGCIPVANPRLCCNPNAFSLFLLRVRESRSQRLRRKTIFLKKAIESHYTTFASNSLSFQTFFSFLFSIRLFILFPEPLPFDPSVEDH